MFGELPIDIFAYHGAGSDRINRHGDGIAGLCVSK